MIMFIGVSISLIFSSIHFEDPILRTGSILDVQLKEASWDKLQLPNGGPLLYISLFPMNYNKATIYVSQRDISQKMILNI